MGANIRRQKNTKCLVEHAVRIAVGNQEVNRSQDCQSKIHRVMDMSGQSSGIGIQWVARKVSSWSRVGSRGQSDGGRSEHGIGDNADDDFVKLAERL